MLEDKGFSYMGFGANTTPVEEIKDGVFGGTYLRGIYSGVNVCGTESHEKNLINQKILNRSIIA